MRGQQRLKNRVNVSVNENAKDGLTQGQRGKNRLRNKEQTQIPGDRVKKKGRQPEGYGKR